MLQCHETYNPKARTETSAFLHRFTCVVPSMHVAMMIADSIQIIKIVFWITAKAIRSSPWGPVGGEAPAALTPLYHVRGHVHAKQWEPHHVLHLHPPISLLQNITNAIITSHK